MNLVLASQSPRRRELLEIRSLPPADVQPLNVFVPTNPDFVFGHRPQFTGFPWLIIGFMMWQGNGLFLHWTCAVRRGSYNKVT